MIQLRAMFVVCALLLTAAFGQPFWGEYNVPEAGSEPDTYYYSPGASATCSGTSVDGTWQPQNFTYGNGINIGAAGTATAIGACYTGTAGTGNVKIALYNDAGTLIASGEIDPSADGWTNLTINAAVSAATYHVQTLNNLTPPPAIQYLTGDDGNGCAATYATFPPATLVPGTCFGVETNNAFQTRVCVGTC